MAAHPGQIVDIHHCGNLTFANYPRNDLQRGAFGKNDGHNPSSVRDRITGSSAADSLNPRCTHVPWNVLSVLCRITR
jgi:hypothetical protein